MILNIDCLAFSVDPLVRVDAKPFHFPVALDCSSIGKEPRDHVGGFRSQRDEIPETAVCRRACGETSVRGRFEGVHHIREFDGISYEEDWQVVSYQIVVSVFGVELDGKTPGIASRIGRSSCTYYGGETDEDRRLFLRVLKEFRVGVLCHALVYLEVAVRTGTFSVNYTLRDALTVEVCELLDEMYILQQNGPTFADGE